MLKFPGRFIHSSTITHISLSAQRPGDQRPLHRRVRRHGFLAAATGGRLFRRCARVRFVAIAFPPIQATHQLLHAEAELEHVQGALRGPVTTYPVAVRGSPFFGPKTGLFKVDRSLFEKLMSLS